MQTSNLSSELLDLVQIIISGNSHINSFDFFDYAEDEELATIWSKLGKPELTEPWMAYLTCCVEDTPSFELSFAWNCLLAAYAYNLSYIDTTGVGYVCLVEQIVITQDSKSNG